MFIANQFLTIIALFFFQQYIDKRFGRLDIETLEFEELCEAPWYFGDWDGFYHDGFVYCFDKDDKAIKYECATGKWHNTSVEMKGIRMIAHPWNNGTAIEFMSDGSVRIVNIADGKVLKTFWNGRKMSKQQRQDLLMSIVEEQSLIQ